MEEVTTCVVVGGGPAGMMLGLLLARAGVAVTVLEKHRDFLRDFRGDTVHASTVRLLDELGLGPAFRALPQSRLQNFEVPGPGGRIITIGDFTRLKPPYDYVAMVPQWDLLDLLAAAARQEPTFRLELESEVTDLVVEDGTVCGVEVRTADGRTRQLRTTVVVGCDGRTSVVRRAAGLTPQAYPVPFDTWWFRISRNPAEDQDAGSLAPRFGPSEILLSIPRRGYFQLAYFAAKGHGARRIAAEGIERFRERVAVLRPDLADRVSEIGSLTDLHHLDVRMDRLRLWHRPGLLCIGDAAHAMSPAGGIGINLAVQDAVAAATRLAGPLRTGSLRRSDLAAVQRRRWLPAAVLQTAQRILHRVVFDPVLAGESPRVPAFGAALLTRVPALAAIPARLIALGPLPEHAPAFARPSRADPPTEPEPADRQD